MNSIETSIVKLFEKWSNDKVISISLLPASGSNRRYYRVKGSNHQAIGAYNNNVKENIAFCRFTEKFASSGVSVPKLYAENLDCHVYLLEDLGDTTLFNILCREYHTGNNIEHVRVLYKGVIDKLVDLQNIAEVDYSLCYPRAKFDRSSMMWDLNYFKYYFLRLAGIYVDEQELEDDFNTLVEYLESVPSDYFMFRDFQSRNIMVGYADKLTFIDYQGGRKGALHYDLASLLYDGKAALSWELREELLDYYINKISCIIPSLDREEFKCQFYAFVLIRIVQALGTYGYRGFFERKSHFLLSIPYAQKNLRWLLDNQSICVNIPAILSCLDRISRDERLSRYGTVAKCGLTVSVNSFSFKSGYPEDYSGNGGGFVFDCRGLPNPGRYHEYKSLTGRDVEVIDFFAKNSGIDSFVESSFDLISQTIDNYLERGFNHLAVSFGCTGGQHRSVYSAEYITKLIKRKYPQIIIDLNHRELQ